MSGDRGRFPWRSRRGPLERATREGKDVLIVDTSGRLHVDEELMAELVRMRAAVKPHERAARVDAMTARTRSTSPSASQKLSSSMASS